jgi:hypothetical protein
VKKTLARSRRHGIAGENIRRLKGDDAGVPLKEAFSLIRVCKKRCGERNIEDGRKVTRASNKMELENPH